MRKWICKTLLSLAVTSAVPCMAQDTSFVYKVLQHISCYQLKNETTKGNFPSYISNHISSKTRQPDDNVFFASLINYTLRRNQAFASTEEHSLIDSIRQRTKTLYSHFQNRSGRLTYNFWRTDTSVPFRYTKWIRRIKKNTSLPDDMDDTVLSLLAQDTDSATAAEAHRIMQGYVNNKRSRTIEKKYRNYKAYSVWYGKSFPAVFDVCVLSNVLLFTKTYHLAWTAADSASLQVIVQAIQSSDYLNKPLYVSPYYGSSSLILYHLARLMENNRIPQLDLLKTELVASAAKQLTLTNDLLEKIILSSAIMKWGYDVPSLLNTDAEAKIRLAETSPLPFFIGNIPSYFPTFYKRLFSSKKWLLFYHYCPAFNDALLLEYISLLKQKR